MGLDKTKKAIQEIADMADAALETSIGIDPGVFTICVLLKLIIAQLGVIAITIAEKK